MWSMSRMIVPLLTLLLCGLVSPLVRRGSGVVMVKISSIANPEGRDAAGTCCNGESVEPGAGVCSGNCYSMMRVCASQIRNDSVLLEMVNTFNKKQQPEIRDREDVRVQGRVPSIQPQPERIGPNLPPPLSSSNRAPIRIKPSQIDSRPQKPPAKKTRPRRPPPPPKSAPKFPFGPLPNLFRSRSNARPPPKLQSRTSVSWGDQELESVWQPEEFTVMWRDSRDVTQRDAERDRAGKMLLGDNVTCKYGALNTGVIFNNSLGGRQRDLLIKLPFEEAWPGMFEFTLEVWHNANPPKIPQPPVQGKKGGDKGILETLFDTLATQLSKTVTDFEAKKLEDLLEVEENNLQSKNSNNTTEEITDADTTTMPSIEETTTTEEPLESKKAEVPEKDRLIVRLEKDHMIYAGDDWQSSSHTGYHASVSYSVKLACGKDFTGPTCSFAKLCLNPKVKNHPRLVCTKEGEMVCRPGWEGTLCERPVCSPGCDSRHGFCEKPGECKCKVGWHGAKCDECDKLLGCSRNGFCEKPFECKCRPGWKGLFCTEPVCAEGCTELRGYCNRPGECRCRQGWTGATCDTCVPLAGCLHGTCSKPGQCQCEPGWRGPLCDQADCGPGCHPEHGECEAPGQCKCKVGWRGPGCDQCVEYPGCVNGQCHEAWSCHCHAGWTGLRCDEIETKEFGPGIRDGRCQEGEAFLCMNGGVDVCSWNGNGTMVERPRCKCRPGYSGKFCQDSLTRGEDTVLSQLPVTDNTLEELQTEDVFPSKLGNALEKL